MASRKLFERLKLTWQVGLLRTSASTSKAKVMVTLDEGTRKAIENNTLKPRHHPGVVRNPTIHLPDTIKSAIKSVIGDTPMKQLTDASGELCRCLHARLAPVEHSQIHRMTKELMKVEHQNGCDTSSMLDEDLARYHQSLSDKVRYKLKQRVYNWRPLDSGNRHVALIYLVARSAAQYAVMSRVFAELTARDACFAPTTLFDFGSGVGTVSWTASEAWGGSLSEYFCVDSSSEMNDIARSITEMIDYKTYKKTFYRQFLPSSSERKYDVVVSSYSLLEMPSAQAREQTLINLWNKTEKYLVLVEYGTLAGFKILNEARNLLAINSAAHKQTCKFLTERAQILAPCPHTFDCPRVAPPSEDNTPCNFRVSYFAYPQKETVRNELFSYLILRKGDHFQSGVTGENDRKGDWPRVVRPVLQRSRHTICRLCTGAGKLQEIIFSPAKHGKTTYRCAKSTKWGDTIPVTLQEKTLNTI